MNIQSVKVVCTFSQHVTLENDTPSKIPPATCPLSAEGKNPYSRPVWVFPEKEKAHTRLFFFCMGISNEPI